MLPLQIISGGQTGVDRAALDFALLHKIKCGGFCPRGRLAEDGIIASKYPLQESPTGFYQERTRLNITYSDATLILISENLFGKGSLYTRNTCRQLKKEYLVIDLTLNSGENIKICREWLSSHQIRILNIAGNRESTTPGIYRLAASFLSDLFVTQTIVKS